MATVLVFVHGSFSFGFMPSTKIFVIPFKDNQKMPKKKGFSKSIFCNRFLRGFVLRTFNTSFCTSVIAIGVVLC